MTRALYESVFVPLIHMFIYTHSIHNICLFYMKNEDMKTVILGKSSSHILQGSPSLI